MNEYALKLHDQHTLKTKSIKNNENSESNSSFNFEFDSNSELEQLLFFSPATSVPNSDSDPEYLPSKKATKLHHADVVIDEPKSTCRRSARLCTSKDENFTNLLSLPLKDPEYLPPKGILNALKNECAEKSEIITNVKQRKLRRSKKIVDPACGSCRNNNHEKLSMSSNKVLTDFGMSSSPLSTEQLRQILEDSTVEDISKENVAEKSNILCEEVKNHDSNIEEETPLKMPRTRSSLKLNVKKKDEKDTVAKSNNQVSDTSSQNKVSKDKVLPKIDNHKESKTVLKKRKRQTCRKQFRHKDITLYKLGADPDPVNEATQKHQAINKIFIRRSSVSTPPSTPNISKVSKNEEVSQNLSSTPNSNSDNKCYETFVKENSGLNVDSSKCDLNNFNKIYSSSISTENHNMKKVPKVILTPINTQDRYNQNNGTSKEVPQLLQIKHQKKEDTNANFKKGAAVQNSRSSRNEVGKHNLPIRIPERRTSIAEPLRTPPAPNHKVPSFNTEYQPTESQFHYMKIEIKNGLSDNPEVIYVKPPISEEKVLDITKPKETITETSTIATSLMVRRSLENEHSQNNTEPTKGTNNLPVTNDTGKIMPREIVSIVSTVKPTNSRGNIETAEAHSNITQETLADMFSDPQNLSIKVVKSCSGITDPLKLHKTGNMPTKKIDLDAKGKINSITPPKEPNQRPDDSRRPVSQANPPLNLNEPPHKSSPILQQNLLNGPVFKSDIYRGINRGNISLNNFNSDLSSFALNSLAMTHLRTPQNNDVASVSRNMPIIEEVNQQTSNDINTNYEPFPPSTSPFAMESSKKNKKAKRKLPRPDAYDEVAPKFPKGNNYSNYPGYNYPLSFYSNTPPNPSYTPLSTFPLPIPPHSVYNMTSPIYQPKLSNSTVQTPTFRNMIPQPSIMNPFLAHDPPLSAPTYSPTSPPVSKPYDPRMHYNHLMRFANPMFMNHSTLPPDYSCFGINNKRNEILPQNSNPVLQQGFNYPSKSSIRTTPRQSPHQIFNLPENTNRRSVEAIESQNTPLALIKSSTPTTKCSDWGNVPIASRSEELTITKLPLRETFSKPNHTSEQMFIPANLMEDLTAHAKQSDVRQSDGGTCSILTISKNNTKHTDPLGPPCSIINAPERRSGIGSVLHGEVANVSISIIKNISENRPKPTSLPQQGLLPILERAKDKCIIEETNKVADYSKIYPTTVRNLPPITTLNLQKTNTKINTTPDTIKNVFDANLDKTIVNKPVSSNFYRDIELEINCTKITKPLKTITLQNSKLCHTETNVKSEIASQIAMLSNSTQSSLNTEDKLDNRSPSIVTILSDTEDVHSPNTTNKIAEAINLSIDKLISISSPKMVPQKGNVQSDETESSPKSDKITTIASMMQNIIHEGDVKKFDEYVEALRRSIENREMNTFNALKQTLTDAYFKNVTNNPNTNNADTQVNYNSMEPPNNNCSSSEQTEPAVICMPSSEIISSSEIIKELTKPIAQTNSFESDNKNAEKTVRESKPEESITKSLNPTSPTEITSDASTNVCNTLNFQNDAATETAQPSSGLHCIVNPKHTEDEQVQTSVCINKSIPEGVVAAEQIATEAISDDSRSIEKSRIVPISIVAPENISSSAIDEPGITADSPSIKATLTKNINTENSSVSENSSERTSVAKYAASIEVQTSISEKTTSMTEFLDIVIKKEIEDEDDDVIFVYDSRFKSTSMEDKGIQADIPTSFSMDNDYISSDVPKRKKLKFLEKSNLKIFKPRTQRPRKMKHNFKRKNRKKLLLLRKSSNTRPQKPKQKKLINGKNNNTMYGGISRLCKTSVRTSIKHSQNSSNKDSGDSFQKANTTTTSTATQCQTNIFSTDDTESIPSTNNQYQTVSNPMPITSATTSNNLYETTTKNLFDNDFDTLETSNIKPCQNTNTSVDDYSQLSKNTSTTTKQCPPALHNNYVNGSQVLKTSATKSYQNSTNRLCENGSQTSNTSTTKPDETTSIDVGVGSQMSNTTVITTRQKQTAAENLQSDGSDTSTKVCEKTTNRISDNGSQSAKTTKLCQSTTSRDVGVGSQMSNTTVITTKQKQTDAENLESDGSDISTKVCEKTTNRISDNGSQSAKTTKLCQSTTSRDAGVGSQMSNTTVITTKQKQTDAENLESDGSDISTKVCEKTTNRISDNGSQSAKTTKLCQSTTSRDVGVGSQMSNTTVITTKQKQTDAENLESDGSDISTKVCEKTTNRISDNGSQSAKTTKLCQSTTSRDVGVGSQMSNTTVITTKQKQTDAENLESDGSDISTKVCEKTTNRISDNGSQSAKTTKLCQNTTNRDADAGFQIPNTAVGTLKQIATQNCHDNGSHISIKVCEKTTNNGVQTTKVCPNTTNNTCSTNSQTLKASPTKSSQNTDNNSESVGSQSFKALTTANNDDFEIPKTTGTTGLHSDRSETSKTSRTISGKSSQTMNGTLSGGDSKISNTASKESGNTTNDDDQVLLPTITADVKPSNIVKSKVISMISSTTPTAQITTDQLQSCEMSGTSIVASRKPEQTVGNQCFDNNSQTSETRVPENSGSGSKTTNLSGETTTNTVSHTIEDTASAETSIVENNKISGTDSHMINTSTVTFAPISQDINTSCSASDSQMTTTPTTCQTTNRKHSSNSSPRYNKAPNTGLVNKRISKRLLLKKRIKTYSKTENSPLISPSSENSKTISPPNGCSSVTPELPEMDDTETVDYNLRNSEIIQNRCFVRLLRIEEIADMYENTYKYFLNTDQEKTVKNNVADASSAETQANSNMVEIDEEQASVGETTRSTSDRQTVGNGSNTNTTLSTRSSETSTFENNNSNINCDSVRLSENVPYLNSNADQKLSSSNKTSGLIIHSSLAVNRVGIDSASNRTINSCIMTPRTNSKADPNVVARTPRRTPNIRSAKSFSHANNLVQMRPSSLNQSSPEVVCPITQGESNDCAINETATFPQASHPPNQVSKHSTAAMQQLSPISRTPRDVAVASTSFSGMNHSMQAPHKSSNYNEISQRPLQQSSGSIISHVSDFLPAFHEQKNDAYSIKNMPEIPMQSPSLNRRPSNTIETGKDFNDCFQVPQQTISHRPPMVSPSTSNIDSRISNNAIELPQQSPSVIKSSLKSYVSTNNEPPKQYSDRAPSTVNNLVELSHKFNKPIPESYNHLYNAYRPMQLPKSSPNTMLSRNYSTEMSQNSSSLTKPPAHTFGSNYPLPPPYKTNRTSPQIESSQHSLFSSNTYPQDYNAASSAYRNTNNESGSNKSVHVSQKSPLFQQTFSTPADFYRYNNNNYTNSASTSQQSSSCPQISPPYAGTSLANNNAIPNSQKTVGRTSYQISKTPPTVHRRTNINKGPNNLVQIQQQVPSNTTISTVATGVSDLYTYRRNPECEVDLTISSKSSNREDINHQSVGKGDSKTSDPKISKRSEDTETLPAISSDTACRAYQPYAPVHTENMPFQMYPSYLQKSNESRVQNEFSKKNQNTFADLTTIPFSRNQEIRQNTYPSSSSTNSQFSTTFRQPSAMLNNLYTKSVNSKEDSQAKHNPTYLTLRQHILAGQSTDKNNVCEIQSQSTGSASTSTATDPKEKYLTLETNSKKRPKDDQNFLNRKIYEANHFNGNLSPDYGYFSPLSKTAPPNYESVVYRPNPIRYNETNNTLNSMKYGGIRNHQHTAINTRETFQHPNAVPSVQNNTNDTYNRLNSKLPPNTATLPTVNGVQHKIQQPDVDKISSILPKLQQSETLNPEQYVLEMNVLEKDGCPRPFLEFYTFVTKKQIASYQLPISFRIFLEFHNAGKLKNFENAFRIYSERHEKEKNLKTA